MLSDQHNTKTGRCSSVELGFKHSGARVEKWQNFWQTLVLCSWLTHITSHLDYIKHMFRLLRKKSTKRMSFKKWEHVSLNEQDSCRRTPSVVNHSNSTPQGLHTPGVTQHIPYEVRKITYIEVDCIRNLSWINIKPVFEFVNSSFRRKVIFKWLKYVIPV